jgi:hypothetical protein
MKLRELIKATTNFNYDVREYTIDAQGRHTSEVVEVNCTNTQLRSKDFGLRHEKLIGNTWFILTKEEFEVQLRYVSMNKVIRRSRLGVLKQHDRIELQMADRCVVTNHFTERVLERFQVKQSEIRTFLQRSLDGHYIVQNYHTFIKSTKYQYNPEDLVVVTRDLKTLLIVTPSNGRFVLKTCFPTGETFSRWFQESMDKVHLMPNLEQFYKGAS